AQRARVHRAAGALAEPLRDALVVAVVERGIDQAVRAGRADGTPVVSRLTHQVEIARDSFAGLILTASTLVFTSVGALAGLLWLAPVFLLVVVPALLLGLAVFACSLRPLARRQRAVLGADEDLASAVGELVSGLRDVVACGAEEHAGRTVAERVDGERRAAASLARFGTVRVVAPALGGHLPLVLLLFLAPRLREGGVTPGELVGALTFLTQALLPALQSLVGGVGAAGARLAVVTGHLLRPVPAPAPPRTPPGAGPTGPPEERARSAAAFRPEALALREVTFSYGGGSRPVLRGLNLTVPAGGHLAVVGPSGTGKSTLAGLVAGLLTPDAGEVRVGGLPVTGRDPSARVLIPQEAYVFTGSVADNLAYLCPRPVPDEALLAAASAVGAAALVARLGGPRGRVDPARLSSGERQSLALVRAWLAPAPVAVLDEATCHLDPAAEARAEEAFARRPGGTLVVIAHRITSAVRAERVLLLDGPDAVCGTHRELLERSALYRDLVGGWSDPAGPVGDADGVHAVAGPGLADDGRQVIAHRALGQPEARGDLGHRGAVGRE
ncbi:ABC transporter ATP-binding protein, partial [Streptomyces sp. SBT349]|uniref:ATP-binding cassette domain-containing protein n=1 Tax=Streptomyces sp. SBT349 TaxID=1580539 RepID=UPI00066BB7F0